MFFTNTYHGIKHHCGVICVCIIYLTFVTQSHILRLYPNFHMFTAVVQILVMINTHANKRVNVAKVKNHQSDMPCMICSLYRHLQLSSNLSHMGNRGYMANS